MKGTVIYAFVRLKIQTSDNEEKIKCQNEVSTPEFMQPKYFVLFVK